MTCSSGKVPYPSKAAADRAITALAKHGRRKGTAYECPECKTWHHTTKKRPPRGYYPHKAMAVEDAFAELERMNRERTQR